MILRLEIPWLDKQVQESLKKHPCALGIIAYLDGERLYHIRAVQSLEGCPMRRINDSTFEFEGEFELREVHEENTIPGTFDICQVKN